MGVRVRVGVGVGVRVRGRRGDKGRHLSTMRAPVARRLTMTVLLET